MQGKSNFISLALLLGMLLQVGLMAGDSLKVGDPFPLTDLTDQHEKKYAMSGSEKLVVFAAEMEASKLIHKVVETRGNDFLNQHRTIILADIHKMPALISAWIALPRMREYNYTIFLIDDDQSGAVFPRKEGQLTLLYLENKKVKKVSYIQNAPNLLKAIQAVK